MPLPGRVGAKNLGLRPRRVTEAVRPLFGLWVKAAFQDLKLVQPQSQSSGIAG